MAFIDVIKYEGSNATFVYKHPVEDFNSGSQLIVHESQEAIFFRDGKAMDRFGAGKYTLDTESLPLMKSFFKRIAGGPSQFHAEVYFVNLATIMAIRWGTDSKIRMYDPVSGLHLELGAFGEFNIKVKDSGKVLLKLVGTELGLKKEDILGSSGYSINSVSGKFRALVMTKVKSFLPKVIRENNIDILEIDEHLDEISEYIRNQLNGSFETYGLMLTEFFVTNISTPDDDPNFKRMKQQHADRFLKIQEQRIKEAEAQAGTKRAEAEAALKLTVAKGDAVAESEARKIIAEAEAVEIETKGMAEAKVLHAKGGNYGMEVAKEVGVAAASNESSGTSAGGVTSEIIKTGIGLGVGVAVAKETVGAMSNTLKDMNNNDSSKNEEWECLKCGYKKNRNNFCANCGEKRVPNNKWKCPSCGCENLGNFCENCGERKLIDSSYWECPKCGYKRNVGKFCAECGSKKE